MKVSDLIGIGRLGGEDADGFFHVLIKPRYRSAFEDAQSVFLLFTSDRVFYVTISEKKVSDNKVMIRFAEDGISEERRRHRETLIAIEAEALETDEGLDHLIGYGVLYQDRHLGEVQDYFYNNAQYVLIIRLDTGAELMVPYVDYYVQNQIPDPGMIELAHADSLLAALDS
ncbi:MAG: hypothetical protein LHW44_06505 [Candidatus Cloacimonetes bacterium]|nr:hypothetical protein [Candidatus Cloacimonadota bacterium]NLK50815.1 hypothetical protein [Candidatus Cloacimonadota bacterium]